jgi:hypothetical protein
VIKVPKHRHNTKSCRAAHSEILAILTRGSAESFEMDLVLWSGVGLIVRKVNSKQQ